MDPLIWLPYLSVSSRIVVKQNNEDDVAGAYQPNWFMKYQHVHPGEAVEIHKDIASKKSLGIHWGTFKLTTENYLEPPALLNSFLNKSGLEGSDFVATDIGGWVEG